MMSVWSLAALLALCLPSAMTLQAQSQQSPPSTHKLRNPLNDLLDEAQAALDKNDFNAAIPPLQKFIEQKPSSGTTTIIG